MDPVSTKQLHTEVCAKLAQSQWKEARASLDALVVRSDIRDKLPALSTFRRAKTLPAKYRKVLADRIALVNLAYQARQAKLGLHTE